MNKVKFWSDVQMRDYVRYEYLAYAYKERNRMAIENKADEKIIFKYAIKAEYYRGVVELLREKAKDKIIQSIFNETHTS